MQIAHVVALPISSGQRVSSTKINPSMATETQPSEPLTFNPNFSIGMSPDELGRRMIKTGEAEIVANNKAGDSYLAIRAEIGKIEKSVGKARPDIKSSDWDFSLKDGKFVVTGSRLKADDVKFLESKLNGDVKLTAAAKSFMKAAVSGLETTHDNPSYTNQNTYAGRMQNYTFYKVDDQLNGSLGLKNMVKETADYAGLDRKGSYTGPAGIGNVALMVVASHLASSDKKIGYEVFPTVAR